MSAIAIGRLLRSNTSDCTIGCRVTQENSPSFGDMVRIPLADGSQIYGLVHDIHIEDDGLVRQLITSIGVSEEVIEDNRTNRNVPVEMSVFFIGWEKNGQISQTRVPRPPLTLDEIFPCAETELRHFTRGGRFAYLRSILRNEELPAADLLTAHLKQVLASVGGQADQQVEVAVLEVIALLKDDYPQLMDILSAISEILPDNGRGAQ